MLFWAARNLRGRSVFPPTFHSIGTRITNSMVRTHVYLLTTPLALLEYILVFGLTDVLITMVVVFIVVAAHIN